MKKMILLLNIIFLSSCNLNFSDSSPATSNLDENFKSWKYEVGYQRLYNQDKVFLKNKYTDSSINKYIYTHIEPDLEKYGIKDVKIGDLINVYYSGNISWIETIQSEYDEQTGELIKEYFVYEAYAGENFVIESVEIIPAKIITLKMEYDAKNDKKTLVNLEDNNKIHLASNLEFVICEKAMMKNQYNIKSINDYMVGEVVYATYHKNITNYKEITYEIKSLYAFNPETIY